MTSPPNLRQALRLALALWAGAVLLVFQRVLSPEPLAAVALGVGWLACLTLATVGLGLPVVRAAFGPVPVRPSDLPIAAAVGAGVLMALAGGLGAIGRLRPLPLLLVGLASILLGGTVVRRLPWRQWLAACRLQGVRPTWALLAVPATVSFLIALTAAPFYDQLHYHLAFPFHWLRAGRVLTFPREAYSFFPANLGLLYVYALAGPGVWAAQLVHWWMGGVMVAGAGLLGARLGGPRAAGWAVAMTTCTPVVLLASTWAAADLAVGAFAVTALLAMLRAVDTRAHCDRLGIWWLAGALAGLACGSKLLALATVLAPLALVAFVGPASGPRGPAPESDGRTFAWGLRLRRTTAVAGGCLLCLAPWLARNTLATGNPVYPLLASAEGKGAAGPAALPTGDLAVRLRSAVTLGTFDPRGDAGLLGPAFLALLPLTVVAALRRRPFGPLLGLAALGCVAGWTAGPPLGRYLTPALPVLAALAAAGLVRMRRRLASGRRWWLGAGVAAILMWALVGAPTPIEHARLACTLGIGNADELMRRHASYSPAIRFVRENLPPNARLLLVAEARSLYLDRDVIVEDPLRTPLLVELARDKPDAASLAAALRAMGVTHVLFNQHEADRIARMLGRATYFAPLDALATARLNGFWRHHLREVFAEGPVHVLQLQP